MKTLFLWHTTESLLNSIFYRDATPAFISIISPTKISVIYIFVNKSIFQGQIWDTLYSIFRLSWLLCSGVSVEGIVLKGTFTNNKYKHLSSFQCTNTGKCFDTSTPNTTIISKVRDIRDVKFK